MILENIKVFLRKIIPTCSIQIRSACMEDTDFIYQCINYGHSEKHFHGKIFSIDEIKKVHIFIFYCTIILKPDLLIAVPIKINILK